MAAVNHGISWQQYCGLVEAALWLELPLPAQLVEYYWDVGHIGHAVGRFCRGKLARPDGVVQEVGVDAAWRFREAIPWTRQVLRFLPVGCVEHSAAASLLKFASFGHC